MPAVEILMDPDLSVIPSMFQIVAEGVQRGTKSINRRVLDGMYRTAAVTFIKSIERPATSVTVGGQSYRAGSRATGNFTFGDGQTFQGSLIDNGPVQGIAFPNTDVADQRTDRAWRVLEEGTDSLRMPVGSWRESGPASRTIPWGAERDNPFYPGGSQFIEVSGIEAKRFIEAAVEDGAEALEKSYEDLADRVVQEAVRHKVPGHYRNVTRTVAVTQEVKGYTRKDGVEVQPYTKNITKQVTERIYVEGYFRR